MTTAEGRPAITATAVAAAERVPSPRQLKLEALERRNRELQEANESLTAQNQQLNDTLRSARRAPPHKTPRFLFLAPPAPHRPNGGP